MDRFDPSPETACDGPAEDADKDCKTENLDADRVVRHIMVIGFHHKHGYQVDYCFPPLRPNGPVFSTPSNPISLPSCWKTLPLLCLPDGSHNYDSDTIYFTMPDVDTSSKDPMTTSTSTEEDEPIKSSDEGIKTIFGTACYRQIQVDKLLNRTDDMTRIVVQKSVCILSTKPLFGLIRSKLEMITHAYFEELDFSKVRILQLTYENLNSLMSRDSVKDNATFLGLSVRHLVAHFGCNVLVLFKAILLEKKVLFYKSPVRDLCSTIMSMCSLFTGLLECGGLDHSTCDLKLSPTLLEALKLLTPTFDELNQTDCSQDFSPLRDDKVFFSPSKEEVVIISDTNISDNCDGTQQANEYSLRDESVANHGDYHPISQSQPNEPGEDLEIIDDPFDGIEEYDDDFPSSLIDGSVVNDSYALRLCRLKPENCGLPLQIFTRGSFCLPYLSISYLDLLADPRVKSFVIGATNFLFKQKKDMYDIIVDMEENTFTINDSSLRKMLNLTTEDLRFMDYLTKQVKVETSQPRDEFDFISHDITKWVGGDEWIRYHFRLYTLYLLKASKTPSFADSFNSSFIQAWKQTTNYRAWDSTGKSSILDPLQNKHPFASTAKGLNLSDMKLKLSYAVNNSERGRLINQTFNEIGKWSIWNNIASAASAAAASTTTSSEVSSESQVGPSNSQSPRSSEQSSTKRDP